jgi:hypothetical protein
MSRYSGYPAWADSPHAMYVYDQLQQTSQRTQDLRKHNEGVFREWDLAPKYPAFYAPTSSDTVGTGSGPVNTGRGPVGTGGGPARKRPGSFPRGLVKFVFWAYVGAILYSHLPPG